jgi:hypothetical protein
MNRSDHAQATHSNDASQTTKLDWVLRLVFIAFAAQGIYVMAQIGYLEIWRYGFAHLAGQQVLADLTIAIGLIMIWLWHDAKANGRQFWPWLVFALIAGSFSPLLYLSTRRKSAPNQQVSQVARSAVDQ